MTNDECEKNPKPKTVFNRFTVCVNHGVNVSNGTWH